MGSQEKAAVSHVPDAAKPHIAAGFPWLQPLHYTEGCELLRSLIFQPFPLFLAADLLSSYGALYFSLFLHLDVAYLFLAPGCTVFYAPGLVKAPPWL